MGTDRQTNQTETRFFTMLKRAPYLAGLWDIKRAEYLPELAEKFLATASRGEAIMARFYLGVWLGNNKYNFDFTDAAAVLDRDAMTIITDWLTDPFWP